VTHSWYWSLLSKTLARKKRDTLEVKYKIIFEVNSQIVENDMREKWSK